MTSYIEAVNAKKTVDNAWNRTKVETSSTTSLVGLVAIWRGLNKTCLQKKADLEKQIADITKTYSKEIASEKVSSVRKGYQDFLRKSQAEFEARVDSVCDGKIAEVDKLIATTGDPSLMALVNGLEMRSEVPDREWQAVSVRVTESHDYQALKRLSEVAQKLNRYFKMPYDPDEEVREIEASRDDFLHMSRLMDKPEAELGYRELMIMGDYDHMTANQERFNRLDTSVGVAVPKKTIPLLDRLKKAQDIARSNGDNQTANAINRFIYDNAEFVDDRQVVREFYQAEAEKLIQKANESAIGGKSEDFNNLVSFFATQETAR